MPSAAPAAVHERVSAVIPVRGRPALLARCVERLLSLPRPPGEVVVVEDGGHDPALADALAPHRGGAAAVVLLRLPRWSGAAAARNAGVAAAAGSLIWFLDSDSLVDDPGALDRSVALLDRRPEVAAVGAEATATAEGRRIQLKRLQPNGSAHTVWRDPDQVREEPCDYLPTCACLVRRACFDAVGGFDPRYRFLSEDTDLCARFWRWGWQVLADGGCAVLHDQGHGREQGDLDLMLRNELRYALVHLPLRQAAALPLHQARFALAPATRARLDSGAAGVLKHLDQVNRPDTPGAARVARVGARYALGLARAWGWNGLNLGETLAERRRLDRSAPLPARFPLFEPREVTGA